MNNPIPTLASLDAAEIAAMASAVASGDPRPALLRTIDAIAGRRMGVTVFSASICHADALELTRIYSSRPEAYGIGERKSKRGTNWAHHVIQEQRVYVGEGALEMAAAFDDQERMASFGIRSIINVPIVVGERCVGVLNFGRPTERVASGDILTARLLALAATIAFVLP